MVRECENEIVCGVSHGEGDLLRMVSAYPADGLFGDAKALCDSFDLETFV
jgi:hypothetical protein